MPRKRKATEAEIVRKGAWQRDPERARRADAGRARIVRTASIAGSCFLYSSHTDMVCPLCAVTVPAGTKHKCTV